VNDVPPNKRVQPTRYTRGWSGVLNNKYTGSVHHPACFCFVPQNAINMGLCMCLTGGIGLRHQRFAVSS